MRYILAFLVLLTGLAAKPAEAHDYHKDAGAFWISCYNAADFSEDRRFQDDPMGVSFTVYEDRVDYIIHNFPEETDETGCDFANVFLTTDLETAQQVADLGFSAGLGTHFIALYPARVWIEDGYYYGAFETHRVDETTPFVYRMGKVELSRYIMNIPTLADSQAIAMLVQEFGR